MSRQIKFRVWNTKLNKQVSNLEIAEIKDSSANNGLIGVLAYTNETDPESQSAKDCVVQQFANILDKNGQEIYEGDICKWKWSRYENDFEEETGEVFFEDGIFYFGREELFCMADTNFMEQTLEVIGNIFGNTKQPLTN
jgi:uncharacterized phage protein (TIGR01671 family)